MPPLARPCEARADTQRQQKLLGGQINLQEPAKDGVAPLSQSAVEHNIDLGLETEVASEASVTRGDRSALQILLRNLIDNALRYLPSGRPVTVAVGRDGAGAWLRVSDDGPGIPTFDREFRRFRRGEGEQAAGRSGTAAGSACRSCSASRDCMMPMSNPAGVSATPGSGSPCDAARAEWRICRAAFT